MGLVAVIAVLYSWRVDVGAFCLLVMAFSAFERRDRVTGVRIVAVGAIVFGYSRVSKLPGEEFPMA